MQWFQLSNEADIPSPALLIFEERVEENLRRMIEIAGGPERLRPHVKTHKLAPLVARQIALGISRFKCATIAEAEMCAAEGAKEVMLAFPAVGPTSARLCELARQFPKTRFGAVVDDAGATQGLGLEAQRAGVTLDVFLDVNCGMQRTGVFSADVAISLYRQISKTDHLQAAGLHAYDGHVHESDLEARRAHCDQAFTPVLELRQQLTRGGFAVPRLVAGGTPTFAFHAAFPDRECSPGTTVLWDFGYGDKFPDLPFVPAAVLLARVISKPAPDLLCLDLGHKAVAAENPHPRVRLLELPEAAPITHSEEHLVLQTPRASEFAIGDTLHGIPRHVCPTVALYSEAVVVRSNTATGVWPITARGRRITI